MRFWISNVFEILMRPIMFNIRNSCLNSWKLLYNIERSFYPWIKSKTEGLYFKFFVFNTQIELNAFTLTFYVSGYSLNVFYYANIKGIFKWLNNWSYDRRDTNDFWKWWDSGGGDEDLLRHEDQEPLPKEFLNFILATSFLRNFIPSNTNT